MPSGQLAGTTEPWAYSDKRERRQSLCKLTSSIVRAGFASLLIFHLTFTLRFATRKDVPLRNVSRRTNPPVTSKASMACTPGKYKDPKQWRSLFPRKIIPLRGKALVAIPIGKKASATVDTLIRTMGQRGYDYLLFAYDDMDWSRFEWFNRVTVMEQKGGKGWLLAQKWLTPETVQNYTHVLFWDDDMSPAPGFDSEILLQIVQSFNIPISQPTIRKNCHNDFVGTCVDDNNASYPVHEIVKNGVEVMVPIYERQVWQKCIWPHILPEENGSGWGLDMYLHSFNPCVVPNKAYSLELPLDHADNRALSRSGVMENHYRYAEYVFKKGWMRDMLNKESLKNALKKDTLKNVLGEGLLEELLKSEMLEELLSKDFLESVLSKKVLQYLHTVGNRMIEREKKIHHKIEFKWHYLIELMIYLGREHRDFEMRVNRECELTLSHSSGTSIEPNVNAPKPDNKIAALR